MRFLLSLVCLSVCSYAFADEWPHWMGPQRDNVWRETGIVKSFPDSGLLVKWRTPIAGGYAGPAVAEGRVFVTDYQTSDDNQISNFERKEVTGVERVLCLDAETGNVEWTHSYPVAYGISYPAGPRATPIVEEGRVYTLGAEGKLLCLEVETGDVVWSRQLTEDYPAKTPLWGYAAHPLIDGEKLICLVGGEGSHAVAFNKKTGEEIWRTLSAPEQGYSPPYIIEAGGVRQLILAKPDAVASVDPESGEPYWTVPYEASNGSLIMRPVHAPPYLFVGGFNNKNLLIRLASDRPDAEVVWRDQRRKAVSPVNVQPYVEEDVIFGMDQDGTLTAFRIEDGERLWETGWPLSERPQRSGTAFLVRNEDRLYIFTEQGELVIARLSPEGYEELDRTKVIEPTNVASGRQVVWSQPAFANRSAYIRNDKEIICVDLAKASYPTTE